MEESNAKISATPVQRSADQRERSHRWQWDPSSGELAGWLNNACSSGQDRLSVDVIDSVERSLYTRGYRYCEPMVGGKHMNYQWVEIRPRALCLGERCQRRSTSCPSKRSENSGRRRKRRRPRMVMPVFETIRAMKSIIVYPDLDHEYRTDFTAHGKAWMDCYLR
jgi:hypothetical protein